MNDKARDSRLRKKYGITLEEYNAMLAEQGGGCAGCGGVGKTRSLHVDHDHQYAHLPIETRRGIPIIRESRWVSQSTYCGILFRSEGPTKSAAIRQMRQRLKRESVRGILCFPCNGSLRKLRNNPQIAENLAKYLRKHQGESK
jgi:hypothetical protein